MDIGLPDINGLEVTKQLRASGYDTPIFAMTAHVLESDIEECKASGMNDIVTKPILLNQLQGILDTVPVKELS